jgi:hypothetical protein
LFALIKGILQFFSARNVDDDPNDKDYASGDDDDQLQSSKAATPKTDAPRSPHDALVSFSSFFTISVLHRGHNPIRH